MQRQLKSNWMGGSNHVPVKYRAASKGKVFTRTENVRMILNERKHKEKISACKEMILAEKNKIRDARERREKVMEGIALRLSDSKAVLRNGKDGVFLQSRDSRGHFKPKVSL